MVGGGQNDLPSDLPSISHTKSKIAISHQIKDTQLQHISRHQDTCLMTEAYTRALMHMFAAFEGTCHELDPWFETVD